jgi:hypothetical protein
MDADELAYTPCRGSAGVCGGFDRSDVSTHDRGYQPRIDLLPADEYDIGRFDHRIRRFDHPYETTRFDESERFADLRLRRCVIFGTVSHEGPMLTRLLRRHFEIQVQRLAFRQ